MFQVAENISTLSNTVDDCSKGSSQEQEEAKNAGAKAIISGGKYAIYHGIGHGSQSRIKIGVDTKSNKVVAIKLLNEDVGEEVLAEVAALMKLQGFPNVVQIQDASSGEYKNLTSGLSEQVNYIVTDLALGGRIFDYIAQTGPFSEGVAKFYFTQLLTGLYHCHEQGIAHRDLKTQNITLDDQYNLQIIELGLAAPVDRIYNDGNERLQYEQMCGTPQFLAPEILSGIPYQGNKVDIFAAGIILFQMVSGEHPFNGLAKSSNPFYKCLGAKRPDLFWLKHGLGTEDCVPSFQSSDFQDIIYKMLVLNPNERPSVAELLQHPWLQTGVPNREDILLQINERQAKMEQANQYKLIQEQMKLQKYQNQNTQIKKLSIKYSGQTVIEQNLDSQEDENHDQGVSEWLIKIQHQGIPLKLLPTYYKVFEAGQNTEFLTHIHPDNIERAILQYLNDENIEHLVSENKYKIKVNLAQYESDNQIQQTQLCIKLLNYENENNEQITCVEFQFLNGCLQTFHEFYKLQAIMLLV